MIKRMTYELKGTFCTYFETDYVRLDDFPTLESDWGRLLHHLTKADALLRYGDGEEDTLRSMLENHVLTVLCGGWNDCGKAAQEPDGKQFSLFQTNLLLLNW